MSDRQQRFVREYLVSLNATDAARKAGYAHPDVAAAKLMKHKQVSMAIAASTKNLSKKYEIGAETVIEQLAYVLTRTATDFVGKDDKLLPVSKMNNRAQACIDGFEQDVTTYRDREGNVTGELVKTKIKLASKVSAIDMAMKHKGLFLKEVQEHLHQHLHLNHDQLCGAPPLIVDRVQEALDGPQSS